MIRRRIAPWALAALLTVSLFLSACGPKQSAPAPQGPAPSQTQSPTQNTTGRKKPAVGGELNLRMGQDADNFNPILSKSSFGAMVHGLVYATLFEFNEKWEPMPSVAKAWQVSADKKTVTITIQDGITFSDGGDLTAEDVAFTLMAIKDPGYTGPRASSMADVESVTAPDRHTVVIKLKKPFAAIFTNINYGILPKKLFAGTAVADMEKHPVTMQPVGAGPYVMKEYKRGQYVRLERNPNWYMSQEYNGAPYIQSIRMKVIADEQTALAALQNMEIDLAIPDPAEVDRLEKAYRGKLLPLNYERNGWGYIALNVTRQHLQNPLVRQALTYGLDRQSIITGLLDGRAAVPPGPIPPLSWAFDSTLKPAPYDPARAKRLLEQAGYRLNRSGVYEKEGKPLKLTFYATSGSPLIEGLTTVARKNWKDIGIDVDVQLMEFNTMNDTYLKPGNFDLALGGFSLGLDPDGLYGLFHGSLAKPNARGEVTSFNKMRYQNPTLDALLESGRAEFDPAKRKAIYARAQRIIVADAPVILVYANRYTAFHTARVKGVVNFPGAGATLSKLYRWYINER